jgi:hypothetical protein
VGDDNWTLRRDWDGNFDIVVGIEGSRSMRRSRDIFFEVVRKPKVARCADNIIFSALFSSVDDDKLQGPTPTGIRGLTTTVIQ